VCAFGGNAFAAKLSGNIVHAGGGNGMYHVYVVRLSLDSPVVGTDILVTPGRWEVANVPNGTYFVVAYRDINGNFIPSRGEPIGYFGASLPERITVSGNDVGNLNVELITPNIAAELRGRVSYAGPQTGRIWIVPHLTPELSLLNTRGTPWTMTTPGEFQVFVFLDDIYYVTAYMDVNGNLIYDQGEPIGTSDRVNVRVTPGVTYFNVDIALGVGATAVESRTWGEIKSLYDN
jgi:hypothetical protein